MLDCFELKDGVLFKLSHRMTGRSGKMSFLKMSTNPTIEQIEKIYFKVIKVMTRPGGEFFVAKVVIQTGGYRNMHPLVSTKPRGSMRSSNLKSQLDDLCEILAEMYDTALQVEREGVLAMPVAPEQTPQEAVIVATGADTEAATDEPVAMARQLSRAPVLKASERRRTPQGTVWTKEGGVLHGIDEVGIYAFSREGKKIYKLAESDISDVNAIMERECESVEVAGGGKRRSKKKRTKKRRTKKRTKKRKKKSKTRKRR